MFNSPILDIAVTLIFIYFIFALTVSAANEFISSLLNSRAKMLQTAIKELIPNDPDWLTLHDKVANNPFIRAIQAKQDKFPSYIPAPVFAKAFISTLKSSTPALTEGNSLNTLIANNFKNPATQDLINSLIENTDQNIQNFQANIEKLFNDSMDRLNGFYKRKVQKVIWALSIVVAVIFNLDSINIADKLWHEPTLAKAAADQIHALVLKDSLNQLNVKQETIAKDSLLPDKIVHDEMAIMKKANSLIQGMPMPMGWVKGNIPENCDFIAWVTKILGLLITAAAISLGAPFWFDILGKVVNMRNAGKKPEVENTKKEDK